MPALEELMERIENRGKIQAFRKDLISARGTIFSGDLFETMKIKTKKPIRKNPMLGDVVDTEQFASDESIEKIYIARTKSSSTRLEPGFVFNSGGTQKNITLAIHESPIEICKEYDDFLFSSEQETEKWSESSDLVKRRLVRENFMRMKKTTNDTYRSHGDRLLYYTIGKVILGTQKGRMVYPLFCFSCDEPNFNELSVSVSTIGFINFVLDERLLDGNIKKIVGDEEIHLDEDIYGLLEKVKHQLEKQAFAVADSINIDTNFSMISVVTGFTPEYLDHAWRKLINE